MRLLERIDRVVIPAIRRMKHFEYALSLQTKLIIILDTSLTALHDVVNVGRQHGKQLFVHVDLIEGLKSDEFAIQYLSNHIMPAGVVSTRRHVIMAAKKHNMTAIQRMFVLDSLALETGIHHAKAIKPDYIELLPGLVPEAVKDVHLATGIPVITGGLIKHRGEVEQAFAAGAVGVTTSHKCLW